VFEDEGYSGATLVRPALERLRDLVAQVPVEIVLCYAPDRLARRYAYQALLVEELARAGTEVCFLNGPAGDRPEDALLVQFQGMIAEYEKAQIIERTRRGKAHRAKAGSVNVLSGAPYGYRYVRKSDHAEARYELVEPQATVVRELFGRYIQDGASIADLARWLTGRQIPTRTGKARWDRSTVWGMLRNPAYAGRAAFAKTQRTDQQPRLTRRARLAGQTISRNPVTCDRPHEQWIQIAVPAIVSDETFQLAARRLADNRRFAARNTKVPSLLQGLAACASCGYAYYRTSARTSTRRLYYYRCLGSDDDRYPGGRRCANLPVRADYLDQVIWGHVTALLADPTLIRAELDRRLAELHAANPARATKARLQREATRTTTAISRLVEAYQEQLLSLEELRARTPALRAKEQTLRAQLDALDAQLVDQAAYLKLAETLESFLGRLRDKADTASVTERQRVLRLIVREVLIGPERVVVRHRIPVTSPNPAPGYLLRGRSPHARALQCLPAPAGPGLADARARRAGALRRRRVGAVRDSGAGRGRVGAADHTAGRAWAGAQGGQDPHRAPDRRGRGVRLPRLPPSPGARPDPQVGAADLPCSLALTQGHPTSPRPDSGAHRPQAAVGPGRGHRRRAQPLPARLGRVLPLRELGSGPRPDQELCPQAGRVAAVQDGQATALLGLGHAPGAALTRPPGPDPPRQSRRLAQTLPGLAGRTPPVKDVGKPCAGEPHARFDGRGLETDRGLWHRASPRPS
jgi:site-specific DNA recombinase